MLALSDHLIYVDMGIIATAIHRQVARSTTEVGTNARASLVSQEVFESGKRVIFSKSWRHASVGFHEDIINLLPVLGDDDDG
jgi:hypothetical protein